MHRKLDRLAATGYAVLRDYAGPRIPAADWQALAYLRAGGARADGFAPLATADGARDTADFWEHGQPEKDGRWTADRGAAPGLAGYVAEVGASFGRVRVVKTAPGTLAAARRQLHRDTANRLNPDGTGWVVHSWLELDNTPRESVLILREDPDDPASETQVRLHPGRQVVIDPDRLWHTVWHPGPRPRYALVASWESGRRLDSWMQQEAAPRRRFAGALPPRQSSRPRPAVAARP